MGNTFFVSDTHFGHSNIIRYSSRPFNDVNEMNEGLIENWNRTVKPDDVVYHLGDFAFMPLDPFKKVLNRLNGKIWVVLGNHDRVITDNQRALLLHGKIARIDNYLEIKAAGRSFVLFHYGQRVWHRSHHSSIHLYGHSHGSLPPFGLSVDVGVDCKEITSEYRPVSVDEVIKYMDARKKETVDHHM